MRLLFAAAAVSGLVFHSGNAWGYKEYTHALASQAALQRSVLNTDPTVLRELGLGSGTSDAGHALPFLLDAIPVPLLYTPGALVFRGAMDEDLGTRPFNHFMDPQQENIALTVLGASLGKPSPEWALELSGEISGQAHSYGDARRYLYSALTGPFEFQRSVDLGAVFYTLGHVAHHVQDMAQPQHVRNDDHCDHPRCKIAAHYKPSGYEQYTFDRGRDVQLAGYQTVDYATFATPAELWRKEGQGISEFTSHNFPTVGTNFYEHAGFALPDEDHPRPPVSRAIFSRYEITDLLGPQGPDQPLAGEIWFVGTNVVDSYLSRTDTNFFSSTYSIFNSDLNEAGEKAIFTLNRFNYDAANRFLLPRAAAYSTGLINYFFRGRIEIGLPEQGVYGIVDHATTRDAGQGFQKLKLRLSNASPDGVKPSGEKVAQTMQGGTLIAVAKYTLNSCYQPDLSGDFAVTLDTGAVIYPANCTLDQYFAGEEQIAQSAAILAASLDKVAADFTFDFSAQPIPVNARDLRIQVVYTGTLGSETDAIAFGGRDISEPTHLIVYNNSDYYAVDGKFYTPQQIRADATLSQRVQGYDIDPKPLTTVAMTFVANKHITGAAGPVPVNGYVRVAVLADVDQPFTMNVLTRFEGAGDTVSTFDGIWAATIDLRGEFAYITPLGIYRDPRAHLVDVVFKANSQAPLLDGELVTMSARRAGDPGPTPIPLRF